MTLSLLHSPRLGFSRGMKARSSVVEHYPDTVVVASSILAVPTNETAPAGPGPFFVLPRLSRSQTVALDDELDLSVHFSLAGQIVQCCSDLS